MKKIALVVGGLVAANTAANVGIHLVRASGGSLAAVTYMVAPFFILLAPLNRPPA